MPKKVVLVSLSSLIVLLLVFIGEFPGRTGRAAPSSTAEKTTSVERRPPPSDLPVRADVQAGTSRKIPVSPKPIVSSPSLTAAYPELKARPADWHQFNRETETFAVSPAEGVTTSFQRVALKDEGKYVTWFGTNKSIPGSSLVAVATPSGGYDAIMIIPGSSQFSFHTDPNGETTVSEANPGEEGCGVAPIQLKRVAQPAHAMLLTPAPAASGALRSPATTGPMQSGPAIPDVVTVVVSALWPDSDLDGVDVLFVYDSDTLTAAGGSSSDAAGYIDGYSKACIESGNVVLANSRVTNFHWHYLGAVQAPDFTHTGKLVDDLKAMEPGGAIYDWVKDLRYKKGADQIMLWRGNNDVDFTGIADSIPALPVSSDYAISVSLWAASYKTIIHELAHNFGCRHDRANADYVSATDNPPVPDGDGKWCYGVLWTLDSVYQGITYTYTSSTIMGYGQDIIPYYSNPSISLQVTSSLADDDNIFLDWGIQTLGYLITDPKAAYNAKVLNDNAVAMAESAEAIAVPVILTQPVNVTSVSGSTFSLTVVVSGGGLSYQWYKEGVAIAGATSAIYAKSAVSSDAGSYTVSAANSAGSVTSNFATVTVTSPPAAASGSGGGGGGGGTFGFWFVGMLVVLTAMARFARSRPRNEGSCS
jgi:hypothetical protein